MLNSTYTYTPNGEKVISQIILNVNKLCTLLLYSPIAKDWPTLAVSEELCLHTATCACMCTHTGNVHLPQPEEFYLWLPTMTKAAFIFGCWKKLQTQESAKRRVPTRCPEDANTLTGAGTIFSMAQPMPISPEPFPEELTSQAPSDTASSGTQPKDHAPSGYLP